MPLHRLESAVQRERRRGRRMVFTNGCFDILHIGHAFYLQAARKLGDYLVVAVNSDASVRRLKGSGRPLNNHRDRARLLAALGCVDYVVIFSSKRVTPLLRMLKPEIYVKGGDYAENALDPRERAAVRACGGKIRILPLWKGYSTTAMIRRLQS
ncbi:MAG: D-glycero-beta-D-manno-heptose 1-phosphate adenylyltransferase [Verrucomicrobia bacterium]|nr:D-glycero-beta-D-manno-heptose 1-phosphate adenylyltransferase [Verrucomicrobiota bacterium]